MFIGISKTIAKVGGFRIGIGTRISKKNAPYALIGIFIYYMFMLCWYMMIGCGWLIYAMCYGIYFLIKTLLFRNKSINNAAKMSQSTISENIDVSTAKQEMQNDIRIVEDCIEILRTTVNPDTFFSRLNLLIEKSKHLSDVGEQIKMKDESVFNLHKNAVENYQEMCRMFLERYFEDVHIKASELKTTNGRNGRYQKFYDSLQEYYEHLDEENINYIEATCKAHYIETEKVDKEG
ncbi:MAG: hypothetical protein IJN62_02065 [Clostridia bacterium]|nr:hypothetical protein [Clostridia bacterium]